MKRLFTLGWICFTGLSSVLANPRNEHQHINTTPKGGGHQNNYHQPNNNTSAHYHPQSNSHNHYNRNRSVTVISHRPVVRPVVRPVIQVNIPAPRPVCMEPVPGNPVFNFRDFIYTLRNQRFESDRLSIARQGLYNNYFDTYQIKEVLSLLEYEESRLEFAKDAYYNCVDKQNYYRINDMFRFSSSIHQLEEYIYARR